MKIKIGWILVNLFIGNISDTVIVFFIQQQPDTTSVTNTADFTSN